MTHLAKTFPSWHRFEKALEPFDAVALQRVLAQGALTGAEAQLGAFLLWVYAPEKRRPAALQFNLRHALMLWDDTNRAAFLRWAARPFWGR